MQQTNKMDNYWVARRLGDPGAARGDGGTREQGTEQDPLRKPLLSEIMAAIHDLKGSLEPRLDTVAVDMGLLRADLQKVSDKVSTAETDTAHLQSTSKALEEQVRFLTTEHEHMAARLEDREGRAWRNNIRVVGVPEGAEGPKCWTGGVCDGECPSVSGKKRLDKVLLFDDYWNEVEEGEIAESDEPVDVYDMEKMVRRLTVFEVLVHCRSQEVEAGEIAESDEPVDVSDMEKMVGVRRLTVFEVLVHCRSQE
ncbi:hypothetical protein NDU88_001867 [Pleurodeles waltl]|uniref:Uncharacterized protein n=1 Tax=Pleurodeles waltl TaxID=8319 RepID=A0AAV7TK20_PLEWA|nr:hypothetical protein NDU88_001867 [Pleurodeles waltl]